MKIYLDRMMSTVKFSKLLFIEALTVRRESFYPDRAAADRRPDNLLLIKYGAGDTSVLMPKPRGKRFSNVLALFPVYIHDVQWRFCPSHVKSES